MEPRHEAKTLAKKFHKNSAISQEIVKKSITVLDVSGI